MWALHESNDSSSNHDELLVTRAAPGNPAGTKTGSGALGGGGAGGAVGVGREVEGGGVRGGDSGRGIEGGVGGREFGGGRALAVDHIEQVVRFEVCSSGQDGAAVVADGRAVVRRPRVGKEPSNPPRWCSKL